MNKKLKIATAAVSVVMAGTMVFGMFGCTNNNKPDDKPDDTIQDRTDINYDENHHLTYASGTAISVNAGNGSNAASYQSISYSTLELAASVKMPDGNTYNVNDLKPAWKALQTQLDVSISDTYTHLGSDAQLTTPIEQGKMADYDIITASAAAITQNTSVLVNLNDYLDYMPNYKAFLEANPVTRWSLTSDPSTGAMYYAPYYDGNDDIEKYCMTEHTWVQKMLDQDSTDTTTYTAQATAKNIENLTESKVTSYMGTTGSWTVATSKPGDDGAVPAVGYVKVDYDAVIAALSDTTAGLGKALTDAGVTSIAKTSGNIVDIQNQAINATNGAVTGAQLNKITQEYIKVAYKYSDTENGTYGQLYGTTVNGVATKISDVFLSTYAAWDVDLLVALSRCVVTNPLLLGGTAENLANIYGIAARQGTTQRRVDLTAFAGELYGIRGMESRYEYMYVGADGSIKDPRLNAESYELVSRLNALTEEGLIYSGTEKIDGQARDITSKVSMLMMHDYSNTQSKANWTTSTKLAPVSTPVSKWDTDDNGTHETIMRFTESWRSVKNTGFCLTKAGAASSKDKLSACLALIDYLFSNDGQLLMTYGAKSSSDTNPDGWWVAEDCGNIADNLDKVNKISDATSYAPAQYEVKANADGSKDYFAYDGKLYRGQAYAGGYVPKMTTASSQFYQGGTVNDVTMGTGDLKVSAKYSYTDYARKIIGTTLPIGNKNQGFEYQATEAFALTGTSNVNKCVLNGTIKHVKLSVDSGESLWYLICPTSFALDQMQQTLLKSPAQTDISGKYFLNTSATKQITNLYIDLVYYGFDTTRYIGDVESNGNIPANGAACVTLLNSVENAMSARVSAINGAWSNTKDAFKIGQ